LDQTIGQPWAEAAAHSVDLVVAALQGRIVSAVLRALVVVASMAAADSTVVAVDSVAAVDGVRAATQWRMK
jgi:hypothetical protein